MDDYAVLSLSGIDDVEIFAKRCEVRFAFQEDDFL